MRRWGALLCSVALVSPVNAQANAALSFVYCKMDGTGADLTAIIGRVDRRGTLDFAIVSWQDGHRNGVGGLVSRSSGRWLYQGADGCLASIANDPSGGLKFVTSPLAHATGVAGWGPTLALSNSNPSTSSRRLPTSSTTISMATFRAAAARGRDAIWLLCLVSGYGKHGLSPVVTPAIVAKASDHFSDLNWDIEDIVHSGLLRQASCVPFK